MQPWPLIAYPGDGWRVHFRSWCLHACYFAAYRFRQGLLGSHATARTPGGASKLALREHRQPLWPTYHGEQSRSVADRPCVRRPGQISAHPLSRSNRRLELGILACSPSAWPWRSLHNECSASRGDRGSLARTCPACQRIRRRGFKARTSANVKPQRQQRVEAFALALSQTSLARVS